MLLWFVMNKKKILTGLSFFLVSLLLSFGIFSLIIPKSNPKLTKKDFLTKKVIPLNYVALGDSLTEGVGDTTSQGGFVPLLSESLHNRYSYQVTSVNYGVSGNTSQQILKRMTTDPQIEKDLEKADLLTLTVGGNDVLAVIRKELSHLSLNSFEKPTEAYKERLKEILAKARQDNPKLPIYVLGIYNPFYLNFPQLTKMQTVIDNWNKATKEVVDASENVYFVPINDRLYKGINGKEGITESSNSQASITNDALFTGDHFHPNNIGYQIMSNAVMEKINETKKTGRNLNFWKWAFLLLLAINLSFTAVIASRLIQVREPNTGKISTGVQDKVKVGTFTTNKSQLNKTIALYLKQYQTKKMNYKIYAASSSILFEGSYQLLGYEVPLYIYFEPYRLTNGAVQLKVTSFSVGTLPLPEKDVLQYIKSSYKLPNFVDIKPKKSVININLQDLKNKEGIYLKATAIDLVNDNFSFDIFKKKP